MTAPRLQHWRFDVRRPNGDARYLYPRGPDPEELVRGFFNDGATRVVLYRMTAARWEKRATYTLAPSRGTPGPAGLAARLTK